MAEKKSSKFKIDPLTPQDQEWLPGHLRRQWGDIMMVIRGRMLDLTQLPGFAARIDGRVVGLVTYHIEDLSCEITSIDSQVAGIGIGTAFITAVRKVAEQAGCLRLWLITTNDNLHAVHFYQKRGFTIAAVHAGAIDRVTRRMKPGIPRFGHHGIPIRDEIELEIDLTNEQVMSALLSAPNPDFPQRLTRQVLYECPWLTLYKDRLRLSDGRILPDYHLVEFLNAVGVLVENEQRQLLFEQVYRYPTGRLEWEIPAGALGPGEGPLEAARREVLEETGFETHSHRLLFSYFPNNGNSNQRFHLVTCRAGQQTGSMDPGEIKTFRWLDRSEVLDWIASGDLVDGLSLVGCLLLTREQS